MGYARHETGYMAGGETITNIFFALFLMLIGIFFPLIFAIGVFWLVITGLMIVMNIINFIQEVMK